MKRKVFEITYEGDKDLTAEEVRDNTAIWQDVGELNDLKVTDITDYVGENEVDFKKAMKHFDEVYNRYIELKGKPGVNVDLALMMTFNPLMVRMRNGERSRELINAMMAVE